MQNLDFNIRILGEGGELDKIAAINKQLKTAAEQRRILNEQYKKGFISEKELASATSQLDITTKFLNKDKRELIRTVELETQRTKNQAGTYRSLDATLQLLRRRYKELTVEERNSAKGQELLKKIQTTDATLKKLDNSIGQNQRNVGNYTGALNGLTGVFSAFGGQLGSSLRQLQLMRAAINQLKTATIAQAEASTAAAAAQEGYAASTAVATTATRLFGAALKFSGIGLVIAFVAVMAAALQKSREFGKEVSRLRAVLGDRATTEDIEALKKQAIDLGKETEHTATQVAGAQVELAKLGFTVRDITNLTPGVLDLASGLGTNIANAAELAGSVMRQFGYDSDQAARVMDVLAKGAASSALDFDSLKEAMKFVGPTARATNRDIEETVALLGVLANNGLKGTIAGTGLSKVFIQLEKQGITLNQAIDKVNSSSNKLVTAVELVGIVGSKSLLALAAGEKDIAPLTEAMENAGGAANELATTMRDNLEGDVTAMKSAWEGFLLSIENGDGVLSKIARGVVQYLTRKLNDLTNGIDLMGALWNRTVAITKIAGEFLANSMPAYLTRFYAFLLKFAANAKIAIGSIPVIGEAIDVNKARQDLSAAVAAIKAADGQIAKSRRELSEEYSSITDKSIKAQIEESRARALADQQAAEIAAELLNQEQLTEKEREKMAKEAERRREQEQRQIEKNAKENTALAKEVRDAEIEQITDKTERSKAAAREQAKYDQDRLRSQLTSEQELATKSDEIRAQLVTRNELINERLIQIDQELADNLVEIDRKAKEKQLEIQKNANAMRIHETEATLQLEELKIRQQVLTNQITIEQGEQQIVALRKKSLQEQLALIDQSTTEGKLKYQQLTNDLIELGRDDAGRGLLGQLMTIDDKEADIIRTGALDFLSTLNDGITNLKQQQVDQELKAQRRANDQLKNQALENLKEELDQKTITQEQYTKKKEQLELEFDRKKEQIERAAFERQKRIAIASAAIKGAVAVLNVLATNTGGEISRAIEVGLVIASTALQIAAIQEQEYAEGGVITGRKVRPSDRNIATKPNGDNVRATVKVGEVVLNERQQAALGGPDVFRKIGVPGFGNAQRAQTFIPGFADGGLIGPPTPISPINPGAGSPTENDLRRIMVEQATLLAKIINDKEVSVRAPEISTVQDTIANIKSASEW